MSSRDALAGVLRAARVEPEDLVSELALIRPAAGGSWAMAVLDSGKVDEIRFAEALAGWARVPYVAMENLAIGRAGVGMLPSRFVFKHHILPIEVTESGVVKLATYDVFNQMPRRLAERHFKGRSVQWVIAARGPLLRKIKALYGVGAETLEELLESSDRYDTSDDRELTHDLNTDNPEASVQRFVNQILREAIQERATDIHVEPLEQDLRIRYRIDGILHEAAVPPQLRLLQNAVISRIKVMAKMDIAEKRLPQDGRISMTDVGANIDVRVSTIPTAWGESVSLRLLFRNHTYNLDRLDMTDRQLGIVRELLAQPNGIILVTGPTGSGKSTTLYSFLSAINAVSRRIITIEDPVEYRMHGVSQIEVKAEINLTFANGLRAILRQDPNVVMVGEIRDFETAEIAIRAAMTGHLVFSTLHTNDAVGGITRLLDMGIEPFLLASVVRAFLAQRLVRTICESCKEPATYSRELLEEAGGDFPEGTIFYKGRGCDACRGSGYRGRTAIYEICELSEGLRRLIVNKATGTVLKERAAQDGMLTLRQDGWRRVLRGQTTVEEVIRITQADDEMME